MSLLENLIATTAATSEISESDLMFVFSKGERKVYSAGEYLFKQGTPYQWAGIIEDGLVELVREQGQVTTLISVLSKAATIAEAAFMGGVTHDVSAYTRKGATVWQVPLDVLQATFQSQTDTYFRTVAGYALEYRYVAEKLGLTREILQKNYDRIIKEGWVSKADLDYILNP